MISSDFLKTPSVLRDIVEKTILRVENEKSKLSLTKLCQKAEKARKPHDFSGKFKQHSPAIIAEVKFASPLEGDISYLNDPLAVAGEYLESGATALSVLTEPYFFKGNIEFLQMIRGKYPEALLLM